MAESPPSPLKWSAQFAVASSRTKLSGDKILLPPSALEQLLSASTAHVAEQTRRDLPTYDPYNSSVYSAYRQAESQYQDQRQQLPHPLTFRLVNSDSGRVVYAGIREFSADEGEVVLSPFLLEALGVKLEDIKSVEDNMEVDGEELAGVPSLERLKITVHLKELPCSVPGAFVSFAAIRFKVSRACSSFRASISTSKSVSTTQIPSDSGLKPSTRNLNSSFFPLASRPPGTIKTSLFVIVV